MLLSDFECEGRNVNLDLPDQWCLLSCGRVCLLCLLFSGV